MGFQKGNTYGKGRPPGTGLKPLLEAIERVEKKKKQKFFDRAIEMAWTEPTVMNGVLKKLVPELQEHSGPDGGDLGIKVSFA